MEIRLIKGFLRQFLRQFRIAGQSQEKMVNLLYLLPVNYGKIFHSPPSPLSYLPVRVRSW